MAESSVLVEPPLKERVAMDVNWRSIKMVDIGTERVVNLDTTSCGVEGGSKGLAGEQAGFDEI